MSLSEQLCPPKLRAPDKTGHSLLTVDIPSQKEGVGRAIRLSPEITATLLHPIPSYG